MSTIVERSTHNPKEIATTRGVFWSLYSAGITPRNIHRFTPLTLVTQENADAVETQINLHPLLAQATISVLDVAVATNLAQNHTLESHFPAKTLVWASYPPSPFSDMFPEFMLYQRSFLFPITLHQEKGITSQIYNTDQNSRRIPYGGNKPLKLKLAEILDKSISQYLSNIELMAIMFEILFAKIPTSILELKLKPRHPQAQNSL